MKIVIDIDEKSREQLFDIANNGLDIPTGLENVMIMSIVNGTPIVRGKWIKTVSQNHPQAIYYDYKCSNCSHHRNKPMPYCEICGAKMKGENE